MSESDEEGAYASADEGDSQAPKPQKTTTTAPSGDETAQNVKPDLSGAEISKTMQSVSLAEKDATSEDGGELFTVWWCIEASPSEFQMMHWGIIW